MTLIEEVAVMPKYAYAVLEFGLSDDAAELLIFQPKPKLLRARAIREPRFPENTSNKKQAFKALGPRCPSRH